MLTLYPEQEAAVAKMTAASGRSALVTAQVGWGKTVVTVETAKRLGARTILIIGPLNVDESWKKTFEGQNVVLPFFHINSSKKGLQAFADLKAGKEGIYYIGREFFALSGTDSKDKKRKARWSWSTVKPDLAVYDEALALSTKVPTPTGWTTVGELSVGDIIFGSDGQPTKVTRLYPIRHGAPTYELTLSTGETVKADGGHKWFATRVRSGRPKRVWTTQEMFDRGPHESFRLARMAGPAETAETNYSISPYVLGQWLGNGSAGQNFICVRSELEGPTIDTFSAAGEEPVTYAPYRDNLSRVHLRGDFIKRLGELGLRNNKHIPEEYLRGSVAQRLELLRGLMDSDGHVHKINGQYTFTNTNERIINSFVELVRSLGYSAKVSTVQDNQHTRNQCFRVVFSGSALVPFKVRDTDYCRDVNAHDIRVVSIRQVESEPVRCIEVSAEDHLFLITESWVTTHNCHGASNRKSVSAQALWPLKAGYKVALSATPAGNKFQGIWSVCRWLWPDVIPRSFWKWADQWANVVPDPYTHKRVEDEKNPGAFVKSLPCYIYGETKVQEPLVKRIECDLLPSQRKQYADLKKQALTWIEDNPLVADLPITLRIRLRQASLAEMSLTEDEEVYFDLDADSAKIEVLTRIIRDNPKENLLILTDSQRFAEVVAHRLGPRAVEWSGKTSQVERQTILRTFGAENGPQYIVGVIPALAEGVDGLQHHARIVVWLNKSSNGILNVQAMGRLNRTGQKHRVTSVEIVARNTLDTADIDVLNMNAAQMKATLTKED